MPLTGVFLVFVRFSNTKTGIFVRFSNIKTGIFVRFSNTKTGIFVRFSNTKTGIFVRFSNKLIIPDALPSPIFSFLTKSTQRSRIRCVLINYNRPYASHDAKNDLYYINN